MTNSNPRMRVTFDDLFQFITSVTLDTDDQLQLPQSAQENFKPTATVKVNENRFTVFGQNRSRDPNFIFEFDPRSENISIVESFDNFVSGRKHRFPMSAPISSDGWVQDFHNGSEIRLLLEDLLGLERVSSTCDLAGVHRYDKFYFSYEDLYYYIQSMEINEFGWHRTKLDGWSLVTDDLRQCVTIRYLTDDLRSVMIKSFDFSHRDDNDNWLVVVTSHTGEFGLVPEIYPVIKSIDVDIVNKVFTGDVYDSWAFLKQILINARASRQPEQYSAISNIRSDDSLATNTITNDGCRTFKDLFDYIQLAERDHQGYHRYIPNYLYFLHIHDGRHRVDLCIDHHLTVPVPLVHFGYNPDDGTVSIITVEDDIADYDHPTVVDMSTRIDDPTVIAAFGSRAETISEELELALHL